ncbi:hypothetical protein GCM10017044_12930 [Kordiimonas sediminis]|uniref:Tyrosine-protein phosphatase n=1 Tax=Kordiimonas sediminis TaxID=1735581 RepID=A0A919E6S1_9PROT|nr:tyrosine-protein phosphatase [Kordiimonas sediminis]GHF19621.1 hypothetical protein GCM10017044_12930 [Kordiimonas sediminis]
MPTTHPNCNRLIPLTGVQNFRDMGGYEGHLGRKIRWGRLFRSGHLHDMTTDCGTEMLARDIENVVDFRSPQEKEHRPVHWPPMWSPDYHDVPIGGNAAAWVKELFERLSTSPFPAEDLRSQFVLAFETIPVANANGLKALFDILIDSAHGNGTLFHCTAGKDRTGIAGALILTALGTPKEQVMEDFLLTNTAVDLKAKATQVAEYISVKADRTIDPSHVYPLVGVEEDFLKAAYDAIDRHYSSMDAYLEKAMGLTPERLQILRENYLAE